MGPYAVTPAGSAGAPAAFCVTAMLVAVLRAFAGMTTCAPLASVTVPPAAPMPDGAGVGGAGAGAGGLPPPPFPASPPPPPHEAQSAIKESAIRRPQKPKFITHPVKVTTSGGKYGVCGRTRTNSDTKETIADNASRAWPMPRPSQAALNAPPTVTTQDNDMKTSQFLIAGAIAALLQAGVAAAQSPPPDPAEKSAQSSVTFESLDKDGDGRVSKTEAEADAKISKNFAMYDKNGNGYIEKDE